MDFGQHDLAYVVVLKPRTVNLEQPIRFGIFCFANLLTVRS